MPTIVGGTTSTSSFAIGAPCPCGAEPAVDIAGVLAAARAANDDARRGVSTDALAGGSSTHEWQWSCAAIAVASVGGASPLRVDVGGKVALFVQGDVDLPASFVLALAPGAELDWYVGGHFAIAPGARVGDITRPGAVRVYVLGAAGVALPGDTSVALSLYAPSAAVTTVGGLGYSNGSIFAASVSAPAGAHRARRPARERRGLSGRLTGDGRHRRLSSLRERLRARDRSSCIQRHRPGRLHRSRHVLPT